MWLIINLHSHNFVHCVQIYHPILFNTTIPCLRQILPLSNSRRIRDRPSLPLAMKSWLRPPKHECIMYVPCVMPWNLRTRQRCWRSHMCIPWHTHACTHSSAAPSTSWLPLDTHNRLVQMVTNCASGEDSVTGHDHPSISTAASEPTDLELNFLHMCRSLPWLTWNWKSRIQVKG